MTDTEEFKNDIPTETRDPKKVHPLIWLGAGAVALLIGVGHFASTSDTSTSTASTSAYVENAAWGRALRTAWNNTSATEQNSMCVGVEQNGLDWAADILVAEGVDTPIMLIERFLTDVCDL